MGIAHEQCALERQGFAIVPAVLGAADVTALIEALDQFDAQSTREKAGSTYAVRHLCQAVPAVKVVSVSSAVRELVEPVLGPAARVVRSLLFDKVADANWKVPWHQDLTIAVKHRCDAPGYGPWSVKAGVPHVQPPAAVLDGILTIRLHLDDCAVDNGPLRVLPGSHRLGILDSTGIAAARARTAEVTCTVPAGGALLMRPLLLHASSAATRPRHRRVIHLEFAAESLPGGLRWYES